ncbi:MAG: VCBS repeat-containing protein, partial [Planctomycetota bacterium]
MQRRWIIQFVVIGVAFIAHANADDGREFVSNGRLVLGTDVNLSASVRSGDLDGDGDVDVVVANGRHWPQQNYLFFNHGEARFTLHRPLGVDRATSYATELADLDGDGDLDIAVGNDMAPNRVFFNDGTGRFDAGTVFGTISSVRSLTLADIDLDGDVDLLVTCRKRQNYICFNDGKGGFARSQAFGTRNDSTIDVAVGEINGDGNLDLVLANRDRQANRALLNDSKLNFDKMIEFGSGVDETRAVAIGDVNGDGRPDLILANIGTSNMVCFGDADGQFVQSVQFGRAAAATYSLAASDLDRDGDLDLVCGNVGSPNVVYWNDGTGKKFSPSTFDDASATYGLVVDDL